MLIIYRDDWRCQPYLTQAKGGRESKGVPGTAEDLEPICEDDNDPDDVFAVYRGKLTDQSFHLVDIMNEFGKVGGFEAVIERLSNIKRAIPIRNLRFIISPLAKVFFICLYHGFLVLNNIYLYVYTHIVFQNVFKENGKGIRAKSC